MLDKKHSNRHHLIPSSRGGPSEFWNLTKKTIKKHRCFHILFRNLLPCQVISQIRRWTNTKTGRLDRRKLIKKKGQKYIKIKCWEILFGKNTPRKKAIEIIKKDWSVKNQSTFRGCFGYKECFSNHLQKKCPLIEIYKRGEIK